MKPAVAVEPVKATVWRCTHCSETVTCPLPSTGVAHFCAKVRRVVALRPERNAT